MNSQLLKRSNQIVFGALLVFLLSSAFIEDAAVWTKLGSKRASKVLDHDEILVTGRSGTFNAIKLSVEKVDVTFRRVVVVFKNGSREEMQIKNRISAGGETRALNIKGKNRVIKKVIFYYSTQVSEKKQARVILYGLH